MQISESAKRPYVNLKRHTKDTDRWWMRHFGGVSFSPGGTAYSSHNGNCTSGRSAFMLLHGDELPHHMRMPHSANGRERNKILAAARENDANKHNPRHIGRRASRTHEEKSLELLVLTQEFVLEVEGEGGAKKSITRK
jgi:hypothetical protein